MNALLADINIQGEMDEMLEVILESEWREFWESLGIEYLHFGDVGLDLATFDDDIWR